MANLQPDRIDVWYLLTDYRESQRLYEGCRSVLSDDERERHDRLVFAPDRQQFAVTRGVLRTLLTEYLGGDPAAWTFGANSHGKPFLANGPAGLPLEFNVSHTRGASAWAVTTGHAVGVDVERVDRHADLSVARRFFAPAEVLALTDVAETFAPRFFEYWTLKEAYIKARGMGLSLPLDEFTITLHDRNVPTIHFDTPSEDPAAWQLHLFSPSPDCRLAVAIHRRGPDLTIRYRTVDPRRVIATIASAGAPERPAP